MRKKRDKKVPRSKKIKLSSTSVSAPASVKVSRPSPMVREKPSSTKASNTTIPKKPKPWKQKNQNDPTRDSGKAVKVAPQARRGRTRRKNKGSVQDTYGMQMLYGMSENRTAFARGGKAMKKAKPC